ncbi:MAG: TRAP transporter small permease subunit [Desulfatitalea sp.]|nr:TRAP transporter small permease subunit [Desulfatitalea sp.]NNK01327.1 TRAP transporter small permease subunit [Desulfatitalea sp.]
MRFTKAIDRFVALQAEAASMLMILLVIIMCMEVFLRYVLKSPTIWALEFTTFLYGMHFVLGYGYTEQFHGHVRVDIFTAKLPQKAQDILYIATTSLLCLPLCLMLCIWSFDNAWQSTRTLERSASAWGPPIWPVKIVMALGFTFLVLQVSANLIKRITAGRTIPNP